MTPVSLAAMIDHTLLKAEATPEDVRRLCAEAVEHHFAAVCVNSRFVPQAVEGVKDSRVRVCTVTGFPLGAASTGAKLEEARIALDAGATEIDMVLWVGGLKAGLDKEVEADVHALAQLCTGEGALLKVILETASLTDDEIRRACQLCVRAGANFVKTSTGFGSGGATVEAVKLMSAEVKDAGLGVKASGGIRTYKDAIAMAEAGATRIGASAGVEIIKEARTG